MNAGNMERVLRLMADKAASDVYLSANTPILIKINGQILRLTDQPLSFQQPRQLRAVGNLENARHPRPTRVGPHHVRRGAPPQQQRERVHDHRLAAAGFTREHVQPRVEPHPHALDYGEVLDD